ncbi:50S ribosomal protein L11 methyltransferase [Pontibacter sp. G13]|uniref:50S ribosomal protein L11 methyltransferase n=1 Tax=Pontibacter sp. G13 TaxID=3074898 RepID=UPI00288BC595|nr:50S ribosomal protein L11 methyltransferase [Pontibacter sp. G13]WNJ21079.1 50S ribosomal protein L11 methyltransferase [Pontibacter sp. G13]
MTTTDPTYLEITLPLPVDLREPAMALLTALAFEAFEETESGIKGYVLKEDFDEAQIRETLSIFPNGPFPFEVSEMENKNWNAEWEQSYPPVEVGTFCQIVPTFHQPKEGFQHTVLIDPKMSFGTGHHETTRLMIQLMEHSAIANRTVLDMGCGTGVLGILAAKLQASQVLGIDIDNWSYENAKENVSLNHIDMDILLGTSEVIPEAQFHVILANINRNVLMADIPIYAMHLQEGGELLLSGFYERDQALIEQVCTSAGLTLADSRVEQSWTALRFRK